MTLILSCCSGKGHNYTVKTDQYAVVAGEEVLQLPKDSCSIDLQEEKEIYQPNPDSVWYFLTKRGDSYVIEKSEETPVMVIYIEHQPASLNVSYGQEGFYFQIIGRKDYEGGFEILCLDPSEEGDTLLVEAEIISPQLVKWKVPNPYTVSESFEIIHTVPESKANAWPVVIIDSDGYDQGSEENQCQSYQYQAEKTYKEVC